MDKNRDLMRPDILSVLKNSNSRFVRDLLGKLTFISLFLRCLLSCVRSLICVAGNNLMPRVLSLRK